MASADRQARRALRKATRAGKKEKKKPPRKDLSQFVPKPYSPGTAAPKKGGSEEVSFDPSVGAQQVRQHRPHRNQAVK